MIGTDDSYHKLWRNVTWERIASDEVGSTTVRDESDSEKVTEPEGQDSEVE